MRRTYWYVAVTGFEAQRSIRIIYEAVMIDFHCHILPGLDDGPQDISESVRMAATLSSLGFEKVYCTPHNIRGNYDIDSARVRSAVLELQTALNRQNIRLKVYPGMEYYIDDFFIVNLEDPLTLGATNLLLFETPVQADPDMIKESVYQMTRRRITPLLAHPERCPLMALPQKRGFFSRRRNDSIAETLREMGCLFQGNIGSFAGVYGGGAKQIATEYLEKGLYSCLGTDGHSAGHLDKMLQRGLKVIEEIAGKEKIKELCREGLS